jgi:hypothetical protein
MNMTSVRTNDPEGVARPFLGENRRAMLNPTTGIGVFMGLSAVQMRQGTRYNRLAIASLALAGLAAIGTILAGVGVIAVFAVGAGHVSLNQIKVGGERGRGLAVTALVIGYAIAVVALISTLYFAASFAVQQQ